MTCVHSHTLEKFSTLIRETSFLVNTEDPPQKKEAKNKILKNSQSSVEYQHRSPSFQVQGLLQKNGKHCKNQVANDNKKTVFQKQLGSCKYKLREVKTLCTRHLISNNMKSQHGKEGWHEVPPLAEELLSIDSFWNKESQFVLDRIPEVPKAYEHMNNLGINF